MSSEKIVSNLGDVSMVDKIIAIAKAKENWSENAFDLSEVNHMLEGWQEDDFNAFKAPVLSASDFRAMVLAAKEAKSNPDAPWLMMTCDCGKTYTITHGELLWRRKLKFDLPCMCEDCKRLCLGGGA